MGYSKNHINKNNQNSTNDDLGYEDNLEATSVLLGYDPPPCPHCGSTLKFNFETNTFKCFSCGFVENEEVIQESVFEEEDFDEYDDIYERPYNDEEEMPDCCRACGGPWPNCKTSCKIFDD